jgi:hypothetical protein
MTDSKTWWVSAHANHDETVGAAVVSGGRGRHGSALAVTGGVGGIRAMNLTGPEAATPPRSLTVACHVCVLYM